MDVNNGFNGDGPWIVNTATALTAAPQFAAGQAIPGFNALAAPPGRADVLTVSGQLCDPTPGRGESQNCTWNSGYHKMMDAAT